MHDVTATIVNHPVCPDCKIKTEYDEADPSIDAGDCFYCPECGWTQVPVPSNFSAELPEPEIKRPDNGKRLHSKVYKTKES